MMKTALAALISHRTFRMAAWSLPALMVVAFMVYMTIRIRDIAQLQRRHVSLQGDLIQTQSKSERVDKELDERVKALEQTVFGQSLPAPITLVTPEARWQRQRDQELRDRLRALEWWRYRLESAH